MTTRRWWKRRDGSDDADDLVPMDTQGIAGGASPFPGAEAGAPKPPLEARLCGIPPELHGLPRLLQLPPCLVSLGAAGSINKTSLQGIVLHTTFTTAYTVSACYIIQPLNTESSYSLKVPASPGASLVIATNLQLTPLKCFFTFPLRFFKGLLQASNSSKKWIWYSFYVGMAVAIFWTYYLLKLPMIRWDVVWLPLGPLIASASSLYVDHTLMKSMQDISTLRGYMYNFKSL
ncbi:unnamed protein product [Triticum turgidum subsp. durum]|uniref:Uncharacterized protein n=1 Tax=Triticum turgidum subsp. durum TaxID=4567 RepID=A0A9R1QG71_TRITD|nr:unnamed protein product [Triticum turgidum subsp. durum]